MATNDLSYKLDLQRAQFSKQMEGAIKQVEQLDKAIANVNKKKIGGGTGSDGFMKKAAIGAAFAYATSKVVDFETAVIESLKNAEYFSASLRTLLKGDTYQAMALQNQLIQLAKTTPFSLNEVQDSTKQLLAYGFAAGNITKNISMLGDVAAGVGQPIGEIVYLYGTLRTQGRAFAKDIYQFTGRGIPIVRELAKQFGVTDDKVMDLVKDGKVGFKEIEKAFAAMTASGGQFFNMMDAQSKTTGGLISNLADTWEQVKVNIGKSQTGILAETLKFASKWMDIFNNQLKSDNFNDKIMSMLPEEMRINNHMRTGEEWQDKRYSAYDANKGTFKSAKREYFQSELERDNFLKANPNYKSSETIGTTEVFSNYSKQIQGMISNAKPEQAGALTKLLWKESQAVSKLAEQSQISQKLAAAEQATIAEAIKQLQGLKRLDETGKKEDGTKPSTSSPAAVAPTKEDSIGTGLEEGFARPQNLYITINKLTGIENLTQNTNMADSAKDIREIIGRTMLEAVSDVNNMMK